MSTKKRTQREEIMDKMPKYCQDIIKKLISLDYGRCYFDWVYKKKWYIYISRGYHNWCVEILNVEKK